MKKHIKFAAVSAALAFSNLANAGFVSYDLTDEMSEDIRSNGAYTLQKVNNDLSIEYWLYDQLAMFRFSVEFITNVGYTPFVDAADNNLINITYGGDGVNDYFNEDIGAYELSATQNFFYIDYVLQIDDGYTFTGLDFDNKEVSEDYVYTATRPYYNFKVAALSFDLADVGDATDVPEPTSLALFGLGGLLLASRRFSKK